MMETLLELTLTPRPEFIGMARLAVSLVAYRLNYTCDAVDDIEVAVGEACADAIAYGRKEASDDAVLLVRCAAGSGLFVITVEAADRPCDTPRPHHQGPFPSEHALGSFVLEALMDTVSYRCSPERGMHIRMARALPAASEAASPQEQPLPLTARNR